MTEHAHHADTSVGRVWSGSAWAVPVSADPPIRTQWLLKAAADLDAGGWLGAEAPFEERDKERRERAAMAALLRAIAAYPVGVNDDGFCEFCWARLTDGSPHRRTCVWGAALALAHTILGGSDD